MNKFPQTKFKQAFNSKSTVHNAKIRSSDPHIGFNFENQSSGNKMDQRMKSADDRKPVESLSN